MSKLIHISAPHSSTDEERKAEEKRVQRMFPGAGVVCLLEGWRIEVHDIQAIKQDTIANQNLTRCESEAGNDFDVRLRAAEKTIDKSAQKERDKSRYLPLSQR